MPGPIHFEEFDFDVDRYELRRAGHAVKLERIPMELLALLLKSEGKVVRREVISRQLWGEHALQDTDHSVNTAVNKLRYILRDNPGKPRFIQTVVGQGYRFIAAVSVEPVRILPAANAHVSAPRAPAAGVASLPVETVKEQEQEEASSPLPHDESPLEAPANEDAPERALPAIPVRRRPYLLGLASVAVLLLTVGLLYATHTWRAARRPPAAAADLHSIAILPFANLAPNSDQDYIVDGMTDQLITDLASTTPLRVISRSSVMHFKGSTAPMSEIASALHVDAVLEGSYLHDGKQVRITANLIDARNDQHLWAQVYEESGDDLLRLQEPVAGDIVREVAAALGAPLSASRLRPVSVRARDAYLRGRFLWNQRTFFSMKESLDYYQQAIAADPGYAEAYAAMGAAYVLLSNYGDTSPQAALAKAQQAAEHALQLNGDLAEAHTVLGAVRTDRDWDWPGAEVEYRRALQLNASYPTARHWLSLHLSRLGKAQEAEMEIQRARALDPLSVMIGTDAAATAYWARNPREAMRRIDPVLALEPNFGEAHLMKGKIYEQLQHYEAALAEFKRATTLFSSSPNVLALQGHALALGGAGEQALAIAHQLEEISHRSYVSGADIAEVYCALNQPDQAMRWLERGLLNRDKAMDMLLIEPLFDGCRGDQRFRDLLRTLKLRPAA